MHVFGNRVPRETLGTKGELSGEISWNYTTYIRREPNIFRAMKSKGEGWTGDVAYVVATRNVD